MHQDHLSGTSVVTTDNGTLVSSIKYFPYGGTRSGDVPTDVKFTGQRLDEGTGLYYYGARYYDPVIGRFISPDPTIPDGSNPQAFNRYSYCINNPTSAFDPSGLDYIFICGSGEHPSVWDPMIKALGIDFSKEKVRFVFEDPKSELHGTGPDGSWWEIQDQVQQLTELLETEEFTDLKLIGHSEGAAALVTVLDRAAEDDTFLSKTFRNEFSAAVMLDNITGVPTIGVDGWNSLRYNDLPERLSKTMPNLQMNDIWNRASIVHNRGQMIGWNDSNSFSYDSRPWYEQVAHWLSPIGKVVNTYSYHMDLFTNPVVTEEILKMLGH